MRSDQIIEGDDYMYQSEAGIVRVRVMQERVEHWDVETGSLATDGVQVMALGYTDKEKAQPGAEDAVAIAHEGHTWHVPAASDCPVLNGRYTQPSSPHLLWHKRELIIKADELIAPWGLVDVQRSQKVADQERAEADRQWQAEYAEQLAARPDPSAASIAAEAASRGQTPASLVFDDD